MPTAEERVDRLENIMMELAESQMRTHVSLKELSDGMEYFKDEMRDFKNEMLDFKDEMRDFKNEMRDFKDEMREFKEEARADRKQMNKQWGDLANKMGTIVEDIIAPNIPRIAREYFGFSDIEDFMVRRQVRNKKDRTKRREFDVIAVGDNRVIINETKSTPRIDYIDQFIEVLPQIGDYFPEYAGKTIIPIFSSLYMQETTHDFVLADEIVVRYLTRNKIYAMVMGEEMMKIINFQELNNGR